MKMNMKRAYLVMLVALFLVIAAAVAVYCTTEHFPVYGISMAPTFKNGTNVLVLKGTWGIKPGDIIVFPYSVIHPSTNITCTHRVIDTTTNASGTFFLTQGDNNGEPDGWVPAASVIGKVIWIW